MGRPIKKSFFGNLNKPDFGNVPLSSGVGGESVASVSISNSGTLYSQGTTVSFTAPQIVGGSVATGTPVIPTTGALAGQIVNILITDSGSGYTSAPTLSVTTASQVTQYVTNSGVTATNTLSVASVVGIQVGMRIYGGSNGGLVVSTDPVRNWVTSSLPNDVSWTNANNLKFYDAGSGFADTVTLTTDVTNAITIISYLPTASQSRTNGDIIKQESSRRYLVQNADGIGQCALTTGTLTAGTMNIIAADYSGATYWVTKLTAHKAMVYPRTNTSTAYYSYGDVAPWNITAATGTYITLNHTI